MSSGGARKSFLGAGRSSGSAGGACVGCILSLRPAHIYSHQHMLNITPGVSDTTRSACWIIYLRGPALYAQDAPLHICSPITTRTRPRYDTVLLSYNQDALPLISLNNVTKGT